MEQMKIINVSAKDRVISVNALYKAGQELRILLRSDVHHDSEHCNRTLEKQHLDKAKETNAKIIDLGDLFDAMQGKKDRRGSKSALRNEYKDSAYLNSLLEDFTNYYTPYADNFLMFGYGNHETAIIKHNEFDLLRQLVHNLKEINPNIQLGKYSGYIVFNFEHEAGGKRSRRILYYNHGAGGDAPVTLGLIADSRRRLYVTDADIIAGGHNHNEWIATRAKETVTNNGNIKNKSVVSVNLPSYKDEMKDGTGWAYEVGMPPKPLGAYWLVFKQVNKNMKFWVERIEGY